MRRRVIRRPQSTKQTPRAQISGPTHFTPLSAVNITISNPPACFAKTIKLLQEEHNLPCVSITLPSTTNNPTATFKDDLDVACNAIATQTSEAQDVVVVAHSNGGMVGNSATKDFTQPKDIKRRSVIGLLLIAACRELFYHDLPAEEAEYCGQEYTYSGWKDVPAWYIGTVEDRGLPVVAQRIQLGMAREMGGKIEHRDRPRATVEIICEAVLAFTFRGESAGTSDMGGRGEEVAVVPRAVLSRPSTWLKFGLLLALGRLLGRAILIFSWGRGLWRSIFP
ncbi:hypothetical protein BJX61DRAFT_533616 [Aspergillus egyptiacus]|nr:hypothetical protein BJX61DRAFT_533616 [Aspergillus egyptiacus]